MRSKVQTITPKKATELLEANTSNRPLSRATVRAFAGAMQRGEWVVTHQGIAFDTKGVLVDGQHRLAAIIEADTPVDLTVFTDVEEGTFDVLDTGKKRNAADVLAVEGEVSAPRLAAMVRAVWLFENRPGLNWSGGAAAVTNHQVVQTLAAHPKIRDLVPVAIRISKAIGMVESAAGAASYLVEQANKRANLDPWYEGIIEGTQLERNDPRLLLRRSMLAMSRKTTGVSHRRDTRQQVALYIKAFNAWATGEEISGGLRFTTREEMPKIEKVAR